MYKGFTDFKQYKYFQEYSEMIDIIPDIQALVKLGKSIAEESDIDTETKTLLRVPYVKKLEQLKKERLNKKGEN